jgi:hypothetical protein
MNESELKEFTGFMQEQLKAMMTELGHVPHIIFKPVDEDELGCDCENCRDKKFAAFILPDEMNGSSMGDLLQQMRPSYPAIALASEAWVAPSDIEGKTPSEHPDKVETLILVVHNHKDSHFWTSSMLRIGEEVILGEWINTTKDLKADQYGGRMMQPYEPPVEYN